MSLQSKPVDRNPKESIKDRIYLIDGKTPVKILNVLDKYYPRQLQSTELSELSDIHRSTVSVHCKELVDIGVVQLSYLPGTEKKVNPTYLFSLKPEVRAEIQRFLQSKIHIDPQLGEINEEISPELPIQEEVEVSQNNQPTPQDFQKTMVDLITKMGRELVSLRNRVVQLERRLDKVSQVEEVDLSEALDVMAALGETTQEDSNV